MLLSTDPPPMTRLLVAVSRLTAVYQTRASAASAAAAAAMGTAGTTRGAVCRRCIVELCGIPLAELCGAIAFATMQFVCRTIANHKSVSAASNSLAAPLRKPRSVSWSTAANDADWRAGVRTSGSRCLSNVIRSGTTPVGRTRHLH
jgi:hypothetical protein